MENILFNMEEILNSHVSGFHQYSLQKPVHLTFASQNLCDMTLFSDQELLSESVDFYANLVHPADIELYSGFIKSLSEKEQKITVQYRIVRKDGAIMYVSDTAVSKRLEDGNFVAYSVLTDITEIAKKSENLRFLNETIPCGFLKYTCAKQPKVTYINEQMMNFLRFPDPVEGESDYLEQYKENIYLMIPIEERRRFSEFLERVYTKGEPISGEMSLLRCDGTKARVYGWVTKCINESGKEEFQSVCMDITEKYRAKKQKETEQYLKALSEVYDKIFEYDFTNKTVKYIHGSNSGVFDRIQNIPMQIEEATQLWICNTVFEEDRDNVSQFFEKVFKNEILTKDRKPPQVRFRALSASGEIKIYIGMFLKINHSASLFCCRNVSDEAQVDILRNENLQLRNINENMQELVTRFTDGIVAFEVENNFVKPLYASDNICKFFGYTKEEWIPMTQKSHSLENFVSQSGVAYEDFEKLLQTGEAEFTYTDVKTKKPRRIKAICSQMTSDDSAPRYVMLYNVNDSAVQNTNDTEPNDRIYIRTFGYFDVFVEDKPIAFRNKKSKELFALLVDRRGGYVSSEEAISFLWEDEAVNAVTLARYRKVALRLKNILEEYGIADIVESVDGKRRIVIDKVRCDLYDYLSEKEEYAQLFKGSYLTNYSWGETTLGELLNEHMF